MSGFLLTQDDRSNLSYLIGLGLSAVTLQVYILFNTSPPEIMMTSPYPLLKSKSEQ